jgi:hypothetical protein
MDVFVMMPFADEFNDVFEAIKRSLKKIPIAEKVNVTRLDTQPQVGIIMIEELKKKISSSPICIADITGNNTNVLWEVGYAMALNKHLIPLIQNIDKITSDLRGMSAILYERNNLASLEKDVREAFLTKLKTYEFNQEPNLPATNNIPFSIAITGSMDVDKNQCIRRLKSILPTFLGKNFLWYVGSYGMADECTIEHLCENGEANISVVGYHEYDISPNIMKLVKDHNLTFIDPRKEQISALSDTHNIRDTYMLVKSNLRILLWDGDSQGTKDLINYYQEMKNDFIVGFC